MSPINTKPTSHWAVHCRLIHRGYDVADDDSVRAFWTYGEDILTNYHARLFSSAPKPRVPRPTFELPPLDQLAIATDIPKPTPSEPTLADLPYDTHPIQRVAVIGGGVSGLVVARKLGVKHKVDVFEAADHVRGRLFIYDFKDGKEWDYFDVGAMWFPNTSVMKPTYDLFKELEPYIKEPIKYEMSNDNTFLYYNGIRVDRKTAGQTPQTFGAGDKEGGNVPQDWANIGYDGLMRNVFGSFMAFVSLPEIKKDGKLLYPAKVPYPSTVINWLETMWFSVGWFDRAFIETVLEMYAFDVHFKNPYNPDEKVPGTDWRCIEHGSQRITDALKKLMETDKTLKKMSPFIFHIKLRRRKSSDSSPFMAKEKYSHVVLAVSPQVMRYMDLSTCELDYAQRSALLMLHCGPSTKVGIKFKSNWWGALNITGGQSQTDRPVRTVVYPSYGKGESTVIIASYCWTQDALTMGASMQGQQSFDEERLKAAILQDLTDIHGLKSGFLEEQFEKMYAFDWTHNPTTMGAYAFFGPGQFTSLYENLTRSAANTRLFFAGEAVSTCHGAIDSANRVVGQIDPREHLSEQLSTEGGIPHGANLEDYPIFLGRELVLLQLGVSSYLQKQEFGK
ncbi:Flavin containing amine oxidoreductase [Ceratobasidium sp. AG-Ba]|nr:Flavin containing amine oxidoreductase [Ceratobasidium sp. AG-Ba]